MLSLALALALFAPSGLPSESSDEPIETITVEAAKLPIAAEDLANRVSLIDDTRLRRELAQTIEDAFRYEPGIDVRNQGSRFGLAGISIRGIGGNRVKLEVDGVPMSDAFSIGSFSNASRDFVDIESIKQLEVVRGPASAMFGSDAIGGVVSFVTKGPSDLLGENNRYFDLSAGFNSVDSSDVVAGTAAVRANEYSAMLRANLRRGEERDVAIADPLSDESINVLAKLVRGDPDAGGLTLTLEQFEADAITRVDSLEGRQDFTAAFGFPYVVNTTEVSGDDTRSRVRASVGQEWLAGALATDYLRWRAYWQDSETTQRTVERRDTEIAGAAGSVLRKRSFDFAQTVYGIELNAASEFDVHASSHLLAYGVEYEHSATAQIRNGVETNLETGVTSMQVGPDTFPVRDFPRSDTERVGAYLQNRISIGSVTLIPGLALGPVYAVADSRCGVCVRESWNRGSQLLR